MIQREAIRAALVEAARAIGAPEAVEPVLERPRERAHGDWATSLAMMLARPLRRKPRDIAQDLVSRIDLAQIVERVEIAGPGFINFYIRPDANARELADIVAADELYGRHAVGEKRRVNVEFVSANPTGPLHVGHGRQAALGDAIASLLEWSGWDVTREYYYNDGGAQIENLAASVWVRVAEQLGAPAALPGFAYHGDYIGEIAHRWRLERAPEATAGDRLTAGAAALSEAAIDYDRARAAGDDVGASTIRSQAIARLDGAVLDDIRTFAVRELRREQDLDLQAFGVRFDTYYLESSLYTDAKVDETVRALIAAGQTYERDGALWLRTTDFGDDKDRVMRKSDSSYTYFVPDVAYHVTKWQRGFRRAIDVQGSDHHSTVVRVRAGLQALGIGIPEGYPEYVLHQMVTVMRGGEEVKISKRAGSYVTVRDLVDWVGRDAVRFFFLMRKGDSPLSFDVDLARKQSEENPVYYIQMAHARMSGIFRVGEVDAQAVTGEGVDFSLLAEPAEQLLINALLEFPDVVARASETLEPQAIATYLHDTAQVVHTWYHKHHVLNEPEAITRARLLLARAARVVLRNGLMTLGISAPDRM